MKIFFGLTFSQLVGCLFLIFISLHFLDFLKLYFDFSRIQYLCLYFVLYFGSFWVIEKVENIAFLASLEQKYSTSILLTLIIFIFDISRNTKKLKIYLLLEKGIDVETLSSYFEDSDKHIQYVALLLYADVMSINPVLQWFEKNYTNKNIAIDEYFLPIYEFCLEKQNYA